MFNYELWGQGIRYFRIKSGYTQEQLAEKAEIDPKYYFRLERGKAKPSLRLMVKICNILNIGVNDCFCEEYELDKVLYKQFKSELNAFDEKDRSFILSIIEHAKLNDMGDNHGLR